MFDENLEQLEQLAAIDDLRQRVSNWVEESSAWEPVRQSQGVLRRVLSRVETLQVRLEAPIVVATFGGTGTGKSSLVNALVGEECSRSGRERPTTRQPTLITHPDTDLKALGIPLDDLQTVQRPADILQDIILLDCPDPDTNEDALAGSNLDRLRSLLPYCDVLLYVSTQQKYRSARVSQELLNAAQGCRMIFVQTHADLDEDIRDDWKSTLSSQFDVPEMFFVDSVRGMQEQQSGIKPSGDLGRLINLLTTEMGASTRVGIRRANVTELLQSAIQRCHERIQKSRTQLDQLKSALQTQQQFLSQQMSSRLSEELLSGRSLWERRILSEVTDSWGMSPFSSVLRLYAGMGSLITSLTLFRARNTVQMAILGSIHGARWLGSKRTEQAAESSLDRASQFGLDDAMLREAELVIEGHAADAGMSGLNKDSDMLELRQQALVVEEQFVVDASQKVDQIIRDLGQRHSGLFTKCIYEFLFISYLIFVLYRVGRNFFYESFWHNLELLSTNFYIPAGLFLVLWSGLLVMVFTRSLRGGLTSKVNKLVGEMVQQKLSAGLFPDLEHAVRGAQRQIDQLSTLQSMTTELRNQIAGSTKLGGRSSSDQ